MKIRTTFMESNNKLLAGHGLAQCTPVRIYHTGGFTETVKAGSKPEYGDGGFEVLVYSSGIHAIDVRRNDAADDDQDPDERFEVDIEVPGLTIVEFYEDEEPTPPPPPPDQLAEAIRLLRAAEVDLEAATVNMARARSIIAEMHVEAVLAGLGGMK